MRCFFPACNHHAHAGHDRVADAEARDEWQRPDDVLRAMDLSLSMIVADVGAGMGYFAIRLARAVPKGEVIATDIDPDVVRYLNERAQRERLPNLRAAGATSTTSGLAPNSVDRIVLVHVWHHLVDHVGYARDLASALRPGGKLFIVDFASDAQRGPPAHLRSSTEAIIANLAAAGLATQVSLVSLPEQYIVQAWRAPCHDEAAI